MPRLKALFYILVGLCNLHIRTCVGFSVSSVPGRVSVTSGQTLSLICKSTQRPSICLWRTPYGSIYTVRAGQTWENGRLVSNPEAGDQDCGIQITRVEESDAGSWECQVGAVEGADFTTETAHTEITVLHKKGGGGNNEHGLEGEDIILECGGWNQGCSWDTPYERSYTLLPGEYAERGRIQALNSCSIRVANLQRRDDGVWKCNRGDHGEKGSISIKLDIEIPLKLSAPTSILQQADEKATLVCHANKEFETCDWETPYQTTVSFTARSSHENGRLKYFGFSNMDCGIVIQGVSPRDSGGWTCRVTATVAGKTQVSADIVRLFVEPTQFEKVPRRLEGNIGVDDYPLDYPLLSYDELPVTSQQADPPAVPAQSAVKQPAQDIPQYDAFDYVDGDFGRIEIEVSREISDSVPAVPGRGPGVPGRGRQSGTEAPRGRVSGTELPLLITTTTRPSQSSTPVITRTIEEDDGFIRDIQRIGRFGTVRIDRIDAVRNTLPPRSSTELSTIGSIISDSRPGIEISTQGQSGHRTGIESSTAAQNLDASELDFLALLSGSRVDNRPFKYDNETETDNTFGMRHSSAGGSRFQFGNVDLKIQTERTEDASTTETSRRFSSVATSSTSTSSTTPISPISSNTRGLARGGGSRNDFSSQSRGGSSSRNNPGSSSSRNNPGSSRSTTSSTRVTLGSSSTTEDPAVSISIADRRLQQMKVEQEMLARRREQAESRRKVELEDRRTSTTRWKEVTPVKDSSQDNINTGVSDTATTSELFNSDVSERPRSINFNTSNNKNSNNAVNSENSFRKEESAGGRVMVRTRVRVNPEQSSVTTPGTSEDRRREEELAIQKILEQQAIEEEAKQREREEEKLRQLKEEAERLRQQLEQMRQKQVQEEREERLTQERERIRQELEQAKNKEEAEKKKKEIEELERKRQEERDRIRKDQEDKRLKRIEEDRQKQIEDERRRRIEQQRINQEEERRKRNELEKQKSLEEEKQRKLEAEKKAKLEEERKVKIEEERQRKREEERQRKIEAERQRKLEEERQRKLEQERQKKIEDEKQEKLEADRQKKLEEEKQRQRDLERQKKLEEARQRRIQQEKEKKLEEERLKRIEEEKAKKLEEERLKKIAEEKKAKELEQRKKLEEERQRKREEERQQKLEEERRKYLQEEREKIRRKKEQEDREEARRVELVAELEKQSAKAEEELRLIREREQRRKEEIERLKSLQEERDRRLKEEREKLRKEIELQKRKEEEELDMIKRREEQRRSELEEIRALTEERDRLLQEERDKLLQAEEERRQREKEEEEILQRRLLQAQRDAVGQKELAEEIKRKEEIEQRRREIDKLKEQQRQREIRLKVEREKIEKEKEKLARQQQELRRQQQQLEKSRQEHLSAKLATTTSTTSRPKQELRKCLMNPWPSDGKIECPESAKARGNFIVKTGDKCSLECNSGFVSLEARETVCANGIWSDELICVKPGAMLIVGGRSDTYGVLSSVELITSGGLCRNAVPALPGMRWKSVAASLDKDTIVVCGGINFLGDPKTDCWKLVFPRPDSSPIWERIASLAVPRDAAAWAAEGGKLYVMGGSLGPLSGYTASMEVYDPVSDSWSVGTALPSDRSSHCAVGLGNGSIIVTGGYGALNNVQRFDINTGIWTELPALNPLRAQHGCALVELNGEKGVLVAGGDSGGTRLNDVRFLGLGHSGDWLKIADLNTARWGRPSVGIIGGKITVVGGWDGRKALSTVEFYDEKTDSWSIQRSSRLSTERRWAAGAQISNSLFPSCVQKRQ